MFIARSDQTARKAGQSNPPNPLFKGGITAAAVAGQKLILLYFFKQMQITYAAG